MRIGILGLGRIGAFHAETLSGLDTVESRGVAGPGSGPPPGAGPRGGRAGAGVAPAARARGRGRGGGWGAA
ncbi:hypothetical protein ACFVIN_07130, partial [Streptomyces prasinus]